MLTTEDFTQLMWQNYDRMNALLDQQSIPAQERMIYQRFKREYTVFRLAHFNSRIIELDPRAELPTGSVVHLLDDVLNVEHSDVPDLSRFPLVMNESFIKFISHIRGYVDGPVHIDDHYILRMAGLPTALMSFRSRHAHDFRFVAEWQNLPTKEQCLCVINHNPIFRMYVMGRMKYFRKLQLCLASILNTVHQCLQMAKKHQFIFIPWGEEFFARTEFIRSKRKLDIGSVKHPENFHYIIMMHILNFFADGATTSIFQQIPQDDLPYINLVLNHNGKYVIYNLGDLTTLNSRGLVYLRACNQMNLLAVASRVQPDTNPEVKDFYTKSIITTAQQAEGATEPQVDTHGNVVPTLPHDQPVTKVIEGVTPEAVANVPQETSALTPEERTEQAISAMAKNIPQQKKIAPSLIEPHLPPATSVVRSTKKDEKPVVKGTLQLNQTSIQETANTVDNFTASFTEETDAAMDEFIDNDEQLTPKQVAFYKQLGRKYEKLTLDGVSLKEILTTPDDLSLADTKLGANVVGDNPLDPSIANCSLTAYDEAYMRSTYRKQFVGAITAFRKQGLFLTDLKQELYQDPINCVNIYTLKFTDIRGKSSTIRLRLPKVDRHNRFKIDGIQKVLKKQRINLPIVKISETEVSISSNYNKCRVIRDVTKAHGYDGYMTGLLDQKRSSATVVLGKFHTNAPISYEYSILADRYSSISFKGSDERHYDLYFDYNHRQTHFLGKPKIFERCEEEYGTFFGTVNDDCLFVDINNEVRTVSPTGAELVDRPVTTIANLCKLALRPGQKYDKVQSEYVNLVTLDGKFPLVFVLAYRFGLRHMLDYMNVKYTIIDRESKEIVSENVGTASFGANIDTILDTNGEPIEGTDWIKIAGQEDLSDNVKYKRKDTDIAIKFKDRILYFNRYPLTHSLILAGLDLYDLSKYELSEFEGKEVYYQILLDCDMSMNYIKGLDSFFDLFIDNMTYNVLKAMHEPTNMRDLLIRATQLLTTTDVRDAASNYNFRIRGYEQFNAIIYNEMSRAVAKYQANKSRANTFSINPEAVYLRIVQNQAVIPTDCANPLQDIKETADMTFTGIGGRDAESFVIDDRKFTSDSTGTMAIDTNDTGKVGLQAQLSLNSGISNTEGILSTRPIDSLQPADVLSIHSLTFPFATHDDSKRMKIKSFKRSVRFLNVPPESNFRMISL